MNPEYRRVLQIKTKQQYFQTRPNACSACCRLVRFSASNTKWEPVQVQMRSSLFLHLQVLLWELGLLLFEYLRVCTLHYPLIQLHSAHHSLLIQDHPLARPFSRPTDFVDCREELSSKIFTSCGQTAAVEVFI